MGVTETLSSVRGLCHNEDLRSEARIRLLALQAQSGNFPCCLKYGRAIKMDEF